MVKLHVAEAHSELVEDLIAEASVVAAAVITYAEVRSTFSRLLRERRWTEEDRQTAIAALDRDWGHVVRFTVDEDLVQVAGELVNRHPLRGFDAIHLATALRARRLLGGPVVLSTFDGRLGEAALAEGFKVNRTYPSQEP